MLGADLLNYRLGSAVSEEYLALAVDNVLLEIHRDSLCRAEILHSLRHLNPQFVA